MKSQAPPIPHPYPQSRKYGGKKRWKLFSRGELRNFTTAKRAAQFWQRETRGLRELRVLPKILSYSRVATQIFDFPVPAAAENPYKSLLFFINPLRTLSFIVQLFQVIIRELSAKG